MITTKDLKRMNCTRYKMVKSWRRILGAALMFSSFIIPDLGIGIVAGLALMKIDPRLMLKSKWIYFKERLRLL